MAHLLHYYYYHYSDSADEWSDRVRLCIFLSCSVCVGLPALVWAFLVLHRIQKSIGRTSVFVTLLLHNDILELLLSLFIIAVLLQMELCRHMGAMCHILISLWSGSRTCGVLLQQMVVLERILGLRHPFCSAHVFFPRCSIIVFLIALTAFFLCELVTPPPRPWPLSTFFILVPLLPLLAVTVTSWIISYRKPPIKHHNSNRTKNQGHTVLPFAMITLVLCLIDLVLYFLQSWRFWKMCVCLLSLRAITDPLLCVLIFSEKHSQTHTKLITDQTATQDEQELEESAS